MLIKVEPRYEANRLLIKVELGYEANRLLIKVEPGYEATNNQVREQSMNKTKCSRPRNEMYIHVAVYKLIVYMYICAIQGNKGVEATH